VAAARDFEYVQARLMPSDREAVAEKYSEVAVETALNDCTRADAINMPANRIVLKSMIMGNKANRTALTMDIIVVNCHRSIAIAKPKA
jgi:hypothetical protein